MQNPPGFSTIRLNTMKMNMDELKEYIKPSIEQDFIRKGVSEVSMWTHHTIKDVCVIKNIFRDHSMCEKKDPMAVVDCACGGAVLRGAHVFGVGVLCLSPGTNQGDIVNVFADLDGKCLKGAKVYSGRLTFLGTAEVHMTRDTLFGVEKAPPGVALEMRSPVCVAPSLTFPSSAAFPQNLPSAVVSHVLEVGPGFRVLDMCAAPGGKTSHLALLMGGKGELIALDKSKARVVALRRFLDRCEHCSFVKTFAMDAARCCSREAAADAASPPFPPGRFDRILLDAPCSALGQRPRLVPDDSKTGLASYPVLQRSLMATAVDLLRAGGFLVYCTCTTTRSENEEVVLWALREFPQLRLSPQIVSLRPHLISGTSIAVQKFDPCEGSSMNAEEDVDTIGFFIAKFEKMVDP